MPTRIRGVHRLRSAAALPAPAGGGGPGRWALALGVLAAVVATCGVGVYLVDGGTSAGRVTAVGAASAADTTPTPWTAATVTPQAPASPSSSVDDDVAGPDDGQPSASLTASPSAAAGPAGVLPADREAGVATTAVVQAGTGRLLVVPGSVPAPTGAPRMRVRIEVEEGIGADGTAFAAFVMDTLNDPRGWGHGGTLTFARTDGAADFTVILASPATSQRLCGPAETGGTLSCGGGTKAVLTMYRWIKGIPDYGDDRTAYRHYLVNHEVGHVLGHSHAYCTPGHLAPVMVQQTKGLHGCLPNAWPFPQS